MNDQPEPGKVYRLTGRGDEASIHRGDTWAEAEVVNRIELAIAKVRDRLSGLSHDASDRLEGGAALSPEMATIFQQVQSAAQAAGVISLEEAQTIHRSIGPFGWEGRADLATRLAITEVITVLLRQARA
jgi:hypothetical protein